MIVATSTFVVAVRKNSFFPPTLLPLLTNKITSVGLWRERWWWTRRLVLQVDGGPAGPVAADSLLGAPQRVRRRCHSSHLSLLVVRATATGRQRPSDPLAGSSFGRRELPVVLVVGKGQKLWHWRQQQLYGERQNDGKIAFLPT